MGFGDVAATNAETIAGLFGEGVKYIRSDSTTVDITAVVERYPPQGDFALTANQQVKGSVWVKTKDVPDPEEGRDMIELDWNGTVRQVRVQQILQTTSAFWQLGVVL